jgi:hypothetical protein
MNTTIIIINRVRKIFFQTFLDLGQPNIQTSAGISSMIISGHIFL